ncbi:MAG: hypothetical protein KAS57_06400 [Gammaproteobacteria bacterium]|nr:hypothetical protein [Gammaproteobacteria bacterium]
MRKLIFALALGAILIPNHGYTLGLGEIEVSSSLNQKLTARIDLLSAAPEDTETLIVKLASREEFVRAGLDRPLVLSSLKFKTSVEAGRVYIDVLSPKPVREPFLNFLVEVDWPKGHLIREYTILLDPPVFMGSRGTQKVTAVSGRPAMQESMDSAPATVQAAAADDFRPAASMAAAPEAVSSEVVAPVQVQQQTSYTAPAYTAPAGYRVQTGDTAWSIANRMKPDDSVSTEQMLIAMLRTNPEVFINENVNGLKRGYILRTPDSADINAVSREEAKAAVRQQNALWREYQQSLSSDQPASAVDEAYNETEYSSAVGGDSDSRLSIVSAGGGSSASGEMKDPSEMTAAELREQLALARERVETERVEKEALQGQIGSLTTQVDKMKGLLTIEDDAMAEIQSAGDLSGEEALVDDFRDEAPVEDTVTELVDEEQALDALDALTGESTTEEDLAADTEELFVDETEAIEALQETEVMTEQEVLDEVQPDYTQQQETGLIDTLLNNRLIVGGLFVALLIIGAIGYLIKRRRDSASDDSELELEIESVTANEEEALEDVADMIDDESMDDLVSDEEVEASMAEAETEEEFDAEATMILPSGTDTVVTPAANLQPEEEEEQDDVLAEADVYLAYGIYQQAEELLENAIKENPDKDSYRVKLAETYFAGKNAEAFAKLGSEMKQRLGDEETPAWTKVAAMGKELCPDEEIFQQAGLGTDLDVNDLMPKSPEPMDFDLGDDTASELDMDFDAPLDEVDGGDLDLPPMDETAIISPDDSAESLDELEFDLSETDAIEESPAKDSLEEEEFSLDIEASELDLGVASKTTDDAGLDFDLSMDSEPEAEAVPEMSSDDAGLDMDLDMSVVSEEEAEGGDTGMDLDLDMSMDDGEEDGVFDLSAEVAEDDAMVESEPGLDLSMDDLAVSEEPSDESAGLDMSVDVAEQSVSMDDDLGGMDLSEPADVDEINTKLDLAKAYLDMGDNEGARDILDEVLAGGNAGQKKEAEELIAQAN